MGIGAVCGSVYLDKGFENLLKNRLGNKADAILIRRTLADILRHFENHIKYIFDPFDESNETEYEIPIYGAPELPEIGLEESYLRITKLGMF